MHDSSRWSTNGMVERSQPMKGSSASAEESTHQTGVPDKWQRGRQWQGTPSCQCVRESTRCSILKSQKAPRQSVFSFFMSDGPLFHSVEGNGHKGGIPANPSPPHTGMDMKYGMWLCVMQVS